MKSRAWSALLKELTSRLDAVDDLFGLLSDIDKGAIDLRKRLEDVISDTATRLAKFSKAFTAYIYAYDGRFFLPADDRNEAHSDLSLTPAQLGFAPKKDEGSWTFDVIADGCRPSLAAAFPGAQRLARIPILSPDSTCFCLILLEWRGDTEFDLARKDDPTRVFIEQVHQQLQNAVALRHHAKQAQKQALLMKAFFESALDPIKCLDMLAKQAPNFLPRFGPLEIDPEPLGQILLYEKDQDVLRIVGTTGNEFRVTRVSVDRSFCGKLIRNPEWSHRVDDPINDPDYKDYLGRHLGRRMRHELAVPIKWNGEFIGILNLESERPDAFREAHIRAMINLCAQSARTSDGAEVSIVPMVHALSRNILSAQITVTTALNGHVNHVVGALSHRIVTPENTILECLRNIQSATTVFPDDVMKDLGKVQEEFQKLVGDLNGFMGDVRGLVDNTPHSIRQLINNAMGRVHEGKEYLALHPGNEVLVCCSDILTQHIYDLLNNAIRSVHKRLELNSDAPGRVEISVELVPDPAEENEEEKLNTRCKLTIRDNGVGVSAAILERIGDADFTTQALPGKHGYGVYGARRYIESIQGVWCAPKSVEREFFEVSFLLDAVESHAPQRDV